MLTRGIIIGKVVDDLASLKYQIETRNKLGQFDLSKFCEDFIRELMNTVYKLNLKNLNTTRSNVPGIDLGDEKNKIAFQVTSQKTSAKINDTLSAITQDQKSKYTIINVIIIGEKQTSYTLNTALTSEFNFTETNILDLDDILRQIVVLDIQELNIIYNLFLREFRQVRIELEPIDENGNFESSYFNYLEAKPTSPPKNGVKLIGPTDEKYYKETFKEIMKVYDRLSNVPRVTREILAIIVDRGRSGDSYLDGGKFNILPATLEKLLGLSSNEIIIEINILENANLVYIDEDEIGGRSAHFLYINGEWLNTLFYWMRDEGLSIRTLLNTMDFSILDE
ncbi:SMEK domain-containing protein [Flavobacterium sp.]